MEQKKIIDEANKSVEQAHINGHYAPDGFVEKMTNQQKDVVSVKKSPLHLRFFRFLKK